MDAYHVEAVTFGPGTVFAGNTADDGSGAANIIGDPVLESYLHVDGATFAGNKADTQVGRWGGAPQHSVRAQCKFGMTCPMKGPRAESPRLLCTRSCIGFFRLTIPCRHPFECGAGVGWAGAPLLAQGGAITTADIDEITINNMTCANNTVVLQVCLGPGEGAEAKDPW